jgi:hypothetical protein
MGTIYKGLFLYGGTYDDVPKMWGRKNKSH